MKKHLTFDFLNDIISNVLIPTSNDNSLIYLFITQTPNGAIKTQFF